MDASWKEVQTVNVVLYDGEKLKSDAYEPSTFWKIIFYINCVLTVGVLPLLCQWLPKKFSYSYFTSRRCTVADATLLSVNDGANGNDFVEIYKSAESTIWKIEYEYLPYRMDVSLPVTVGQFTPSVMRFDRPLNELYAEYVNQPALAPAECERRMGVFGTNTIEVPLPSDTYLLFQGVMHPFSVFQFFGCVIWYLTDYWIFATVVVIITIISAFIDFLQTRASLIKLQALVLFHAESSVKRQRPSFADNQSGDWTVVDASELVPGDVVELKGSQVVPCDILVVDGRCVVNEALLTGESFPVVKSSLDASKNESSRFTSEFDKNLTLYAGTKILLAQPGATTGRAFGVVIRTGFTTTKGSLIRSILLPIASRLSVYRDALFFMFLLFIFGTAVGIYTVVSKMEQPKQTAYKLTLAFFNMITIAIPVSLPLTLTVATIEAVQRLRTKQISCLDRTRVQVAGIIDIMAFDKTGTLTELELDVHGFRPCVGAEFRQHCTAANSSVSNLPRLELTSPLNMVAATCHSLTIMSGVPVGDPLDVKMYSASGWALGADGLCSCPPQGGRPGPTLRAVRSFEFSSTLQRMTVVCQLDGGAYHVFSKGSPSMISNICDPGSLPPDFAKVLSVYTSAGYRVLACASKQTGVVDVGRQELERGLLFAGFLVMNNKVRDGSREVVDDLGFGGVRSKMITGDGTETAVHVAKVCGILMPGPILIAEMQVKIVRCWFPSPILPPVRGSFSDSSVCTRVTSHTSPNLVPLASVCLLLCTARTWRTTRAGI
jgi:cation-transporting ATPase 13A2